MNRNVRSLALAMAVIIVLASCQPAVEPGSTPEESAVAGVVERLFSTGSVELLDAQGARDLDEAIGVCMRAEGFEYYPKPIDAGLVVGPVSVDGIQYGTDEWTERFGFGVSTQRYDPLLIGANLEGVAGGVGAARVVDRNEEYVDGLPASGRMAYLAALDGTPLDRIERTGEQEQTLYARSCEGTAVAALAPELLLLDSLMPELVDIGERFANSSAVVEENARVRRCIVEAGYDPMTEGSAEKVISDRLSREVESRIDWSVGPTLPGDGIETLREIQRLEIEWAQALGVCGGLSYQRVPEVQVVLDSLRDEFVSRYVTPLAGE